MIKLNIQYSIIHVQNIKTAAPNSCGYVAHAVTHTCKASRSNVRIKGREIGQPMGTRLGPHTLPNKKATWYGYSRKLSGSLRAYRIYVLSNFGHGSRVTGRTPFDLVKIEDADQMPRFNI